MFRRGRTRGKLDTALDAEKSEKHVIIRVPAVIKTLEDAVRRESLAGCHGHSTVIGRVFRVGIKGNGVFLRLITDKN
ncbi:hypothetical protein DPMN_136911 [Dreissena polymorpha]|uniref:Uncharacterized protein n=1 Tax=Dreissena polymorpha TaxID=45954 RepID=A0A9D4G0T0_DREPO|nr:hypothetical protein DPMN_136911 [Dreissena polymorpha]